MILAIYNGVRIGWSEMLAHPVRSLLTASGIILGVTALVTTVSVVSGMFSFWDVQLRESGGVERFSVRATSPPAHQSDIEHRSPGLTTRDALAILENCQFISGVSPQTEDWRNRIFADNGRSYGFRMRGVRPDYFQQYNFDTEEGRFISWEEYGRAATVIVLTQEARFRLFPDRVSVLGETVRVRGIPFTVIGVIQDYQLDFNMGASSWNMLRWKTSGSFIPLTTVQQRLRGPASGRAPDSIDSLDVRVSDIRYLDHAVSQVENVLTFTHQGIRDFTVETRVEELERMEQSRMTYYAALGGVGAISLLVGGLGIMNVMLASVSDRLREIGIRKAVGAADADIFLQVLVESSVISILGGILGIAGAVLVVDLLSGVLEDSQLRPELSVEALILGFGFSVAVGIVAGIYPAIKAARLDPIDALRYE